MSRSGHTPSCHGLSWGGGSSHIAVFSVAKRQHKVPFFTLYMYLNTNESYWRKTLTTQKDPCGVICDVTLSKKYKIRVRRHASSVWQQYLMCLRSDCIVYDYVAKWTISVFPVGLSMAKSRDWSDLIWPAWINSRYTTFGYPGACYFLKVWSFKKKKRLPVVGKWQLCESASFHDHAEVHLWRHRWLDQWPDLKKWLKMKNVRNVRLKWGSHSRFHLSIANGSGAIARKPSGVAATPLGRRGLMMNFHISNSVVKVM